MTPPTVPTRPRRSLGPWLVVLGLVLALGGAGWWYAGRPVPAKERPAIVAEKSEPAEKKDDDGGFLGEFLEKKGTITESNEPAPDDRALEKKFAEFLDLQERMQTLLEEAVTQRALGNEKAFERAAKERERLLQQLQANLPSFEKDLGQARTARPEAGVPAWLTGEVLILIGGEPDVILPYLRRALAAGLDRPRVLASLALALSEANQFDEAYQTAGRAIATGGQDRYVWNAYIRTGFYTQHFAEVGARLKKGFPTTRPPWVAEALAQADLRAGRWQEEQKRRAAEDRAGDLPRVRLTIEHRRFARDAQGVPLTTVESTGSGAVVLELFEDQAPMAVANFLSLVEAKQYDGTRFHLAQPAILVEGGDVKSRSRDAAHDGTGSPGYAIPDEHGRPDARHHYRGSLSLVNNGPNTAGSRFFITLVPMPEMDGQFTVFGRVVAGQEVVDCITRGRTNEDVGPIGRIIPGDLLVRAEVLRKRPHEYKVMKVE